MDNQRHMAITLATQYSLAPEAVVQVVVVVDTQMVLMAATAEMEAVK